jgi:hypothetical protein
LVKKDKLRMFMPLAPKKFKNFVRVLHFNEGNGPTKEMLE